MQDTPSPAVPAPIHVRITTTFTGTAVSCGVGQLAGVRYYDGHDTFLQLVAHIKLINYAQAYGSARWSAMRHGLPVTRRLTGAFVVWSDVDDYNNGGAKFAAYVKARFPQEPAPVETHSALNPNSGNDVKVWVWQLPEALLTTEEYDAIVVEEPRT